MKGTKREPFVVEEKSCSINLNFSVGSWASSVLPTIPFFQDAQDQICKAGNSIIKIDSLKTGTETSGKQVDTLISFTVNGQKAVSHFYHTTQRIMINGQAYKTLAYDFLAPFFEAKIGSKSDEIELFNRQTLDDLYPVKPQSKVLRRKISKVSGIFFL